MDRKHRFAASRADGRAGFMPVSDHRARTNGAGADGEVPWSWRLDAGVKSRGGEAARPGSDQPYPRDGGDKKVRSPPKARRKTVKTFLRAL